MNTVQLPAIPHDAIVPVTGYVHGDKISFWCEHEHRWHHHSRALGPVSPHCVCPVSRFGITAFRIVAIGGEFTYEVRRAHPRRHPRCATCSGARA